MKRFAIIILSVLVLYAGVAWALEACLRHDGHSDHSTFENRSEFHAPVGHDHSQDASLPIIHCTLVTHQVGPAARVTLAETPRSDKGAALDVVSFPDAVSATLKSNLWLDAVFRGIVTISSPIDLARHLFLSVLQI